MTAPAPSVDAYLDAQPDASRAALERVRRLVHEVLPEVEERIAYGMPTFSAEGRVVLHVAGWSTHLSVYPAPSAPSDLVADLAPYRSGKSTLRFPLGPTVSDDLVRRTVAALAAERA